ncbi:MAG: hypothetical protein AAF333_14530 [Planctomycetota bacterium]
MEKVGYFGRLLRSGYWSFGLIVFVVLFYFAGLHVDRYEMDTITGSIREYREWDWWGQSNKRVQVSSLENWILQHEGSYENDWEFVSGERKSVIMLDVALLNGGAPPIFPLAAHADALDAFTIYADPYEIEAFVDIMRVGDHDEQQEAVEKVLRRGVQLWDSRQ